MKRLSIKVRVTLWYTLFMTVLTLTVLLLLLRIGDRQIAASTQSRLEQVVSENLKEIEYNEETGLDIDDDLNAFEDGVYLILYDQEGNHIYGQLPGGLKASQTPAFRNGERQEINTDSVKWQVFDIYEPLNKNAGVWLRGLVSQTDAESGLNIVLRLSMLLLPLFVILIALGGYYITYRAFAPVEQMRRTAEEIAGGDDLSKRIELDGGKDEIYQLADTFDRMLDRIEDAFEREKQFTSDVSHELRTPVSVIGAQAEYALRRDNPSEELKERLDIILKQSRKMSGMISQLLILARADQGREKIQNERIHLSELIEIIAEEERERAENKNIKIITDCQPDLYLTGDETLLMRCFMNLIENAITYGRDGGNIWISLTEREGFIQGYIRDDGIGIREENLPRIWERFYQVDSSRSASEGGSSGLGLSMVKWIVEAHEGKITVESRYEKGTIFHFCFPGNKEKSLTV